MNNGIRGRACPRGSGERGRVRKPLEQGLQPLVSNGIENLNIGFSRVRYRAGFESLSHRLSTSDTEALEVSKGVRLSTYGSLWFNIENGNIENGKPVPVKAGI